MKNNDDTKLALAIYGIAIVLSGVIGFLITQ